MFPEDIKDSTPRLGHYDNSDTHNTRVSFKLFDPCGSATWYVCEANFDEEDMPAFGYVTGLGEDELGHFSLKEISELKGLLFNLPMERDILWDPETTLKAVMDKKVR